jgi:hypothetical protein
MSLVYGIVSGGEFASNRMKFRTSEPNGIYCVDMTEDDFKSSLMMADIDEAVKFFRKNSKFNVIRGVSFHNGIIPENPVKFTNIPISITDATYDEFEEVEAVLVKKTGQYYFLRTVCTEKAFPLMEVKEAFESQENIEEIKGLSPEIRIVHFFHLLERQRIEEEEREAERRELLAIREEQERVPKNRITNALEESGATLVSIRKVNRGHEIVWSASGHTINTLLNDNYRVIEAGFCVSGYDNTQSVSSVAKVLQDYVDQGDWVHKTRTI